VKLTGSHTLSAPRQKVWDFFNDPNRLATVLPGCERLEPVGPDQYKAAIKFTLAAFSGSYSATVAITEKRPPESMRMSVQGKGGPGFMKGTGALQFEEAAAATRVSYDGDVQVGGIIAAVGGRMIEAAAKKILQQFFESVENQLSQT